MYVIIKSNNKQNTQFIINYYTTHFTNIEIIVLSDIQFDNVINKSKNDHYIIDYKFKKYDLLLFHDDNVYVKELPTSCAYCEDILCIKKKHYEFFNKFNVVYNVLYFLDIVIKTKKTFNVYFSDLRIEYINKIEKNSLILYLENKLIQKFNSKTFRHFVVHNKLNIHTIKYIENNILHDKEYYNIIWCTHNYFNDIQKYNNITVVKKQTSYDNILKVFDGFIIDTFIEEQYKYVFFKVINLPTSYNFYYNNIKKYYNITERNKTIIEIDLKDGFINQHVIETINNGINDCINNSVNNGINNNVNNGINNDIYIFDDLIICSLITTYHNTANKQLYIDKIKKAKYYIVFTEYFINDELVITGCGIKEYEFTKLLFGNSLKLLISNNENACYCINNDIDYYYFPPYGHSVINNIVPLVKDICVYDIVFYGNVLNNSFYAHRKNTLMNIKKRCNECGYTFDCFDNIYDDSKNWVLERTKIIIHVLQKKNYTILSWAKIMELMCKKVFFIIEENDEIYKNMLENIVVYYKKNNIDDLMEKIHYYINNDIEKNRIIDVLYDYVKNKYDMDYFVKNIFLN